MKWLFVVEAVTYTFHVVSGRPPWCHVGVNLNYTLLTREYHTQPTLLPTQPRVLVSGNFSLEFWSPLAEGMNE